MQVVHQLIDERPVGGVHARFHVARGHVQRGAGGGALLHQEQPYALLHISQDPFLLGRQCVLRRDLLLSIGQQKVQGGPQTVGVVLSQRAAHARDLLEGLLVHLRLAYGLPIECQQVAQVRVAVHAAAVGEGRDQQQQQPRVGRQQAAHRRPVAHGRLHAPQPAQVLESLAQVHRLQALSASLEKVVRARLVHLALGNLGHHQPQRADKVGVIILPARHVRRLRRQEGVQRHQRAQALVLEPLALRHGLAHVRHQPIQVGLHVRAVVAAHALQQGVVHQPGLVGTDGLVLRQRVHDRQHLLVRGVGSRGDDRLQNGRKSVGLRLLSKGLGVAGRQGHDALHRGLPVVRC